MHVYSGTPLNLDADETKESVHMSGVCSSVIKQVRKDKVSLLDLCIREVSSFQVFLEYVLCSCNGPLSTTCSW